MTVAPASDVSTATMVNNELLVSAVICTYRRPDRLRAAIESLLDQTMPPESYEVIVIDNKSRDDTQSVVTEIADRLEQGRPRLRYVLEASQGLSHARNRSIAVAQADVIAFLDDDAVASSDWLRTLLSGFDVSSDVWAVGGKVLPIWGTKRPGWLTDGMLPSLSLIDWGDEQKALVWPERIIGVNCSFRRIAFAEVGLFSTDLGRKGDLLLGFEDTEIQQRIHDVGKQVVYVPTALVHHHVPPERITRRYFYNRDYGTGRSRAIRTAMRINKWATIGHAIKLMFTIPYKAAKVVIPFRFSSRSAPQPAIRKLSTESTINRLQSLVGDIGFVVQTGLLLLTWARLRRQD